MNEFEYRAFFDGSSKPNPGLKKIGGFIKNKNNEIVFSYSKDLGFGTNNEAEYESLIRLLQEIVDKKYHNIVISGDSSLVVNQVNGLWKCKHPNMKELKSQAERLIKQIDNCKLIFVPREINHEADKLTR